MTSPEETRRPDPKKWFPRLLLAAFIFELANLFAIATTQGVIQLPVLSGNRFHSFAVHAALCWLFFATREAIRFRSDDTVHRQLRVAKLAILALCLFGALLTFQYGIRLSADSPHYFVQARSLLFDGDWDFANDYEQLGAPNPRPGICPVGTALLSLPFLLATHVLCLVARALGHAVPTNGFGYAYETGWGLAGYIFAAAALFVTLRTVSRHFSVGTTSLSLVTAWASSFLLWYMVVEPGMPHAMSFAWTTFFLCFWIEKRPLARVRDWLLLGALAGIAALVRWQNGVLLVLPIVDTILDSPRQSIRAAWALAAAAVSFVPQLVFWQVNAGDPLAVPFDRFGAVWDQLSVLEVLYSTNRGLFPWNPVLYLGTIGLLVWAKGSPRLAGLFLLGFGLQVVINSNVAYWWSGWSFGGRRFDSCFLFFVAGTAAFFQFLRRRPLVPVVGLCVFLGLWSFGVMIQARRGEIPPDRVVSFRSVSEYNVRYFYERIGLPFASPMNWLFARRYDVSPEKFDRLYGHQGFGNLRLRFDRESEPFLGTGWGEPEVDPGGRWFRWSIGSQATILVPLRNPRAYELTIVVRPFKDASPNRVGLQVNHRSQRLRHLQEETTLNWQLGAESWRRGINELRFELARTARPSADGTSPDSRELGAAFYELNLIAIPDDEP